MLNRLLAAPLALVLLSAAAMAEDQVGVPVGRQLNASEPMTAPGIVGVDYSANPPSLSGMTLLNTIPAVPQGKTRRGYFVIANCMAGMTVVWDDGTDTGANCTPGKCTAQPYEGASANGYQGGGVDYAAYPHSGRIRVYSDDPTCQMAAHAW